MPTDPERPEEWWTRAQTWKLAARGTVGVVLVLAIVGLGGHFAHDELERLGRWFIGTLGYGGMAIGTFLADGLHFPVPPQFYMFIVVTAGGRATFALAAICLGSIAGGHVAYSLSRKALGLRFVRRPIEKIAPSVARLVHRFGPWAIVLASLLPVPYSLVCYLCGLNRVPYRLFALLSALRIPKLVGYYFLIAAGWSV